MPVLKNTRHERFAQEMAKGKTATEAYINAGYDVGSEKSANEAGSRLSRDVKVRARLDELQEKAAVRTEITITSLLAEAEEARVLAMNIKNPAAAISAVREKGVLSGRRVERLEQGSPGEFEGMNADELRNSIARDLATLGREDLAAALVGGSGEARGKLN